MKKWKSLFAVAAIATMVFAMAACGDKDTAADPTEAPNPTEAPADPTEAPADPTEAPADPTEAPADPTEAPADPTEAPADPTEEPAPTEEPVVEPTEEPAPTEEPVVEPTVAPTEAPVATEAPEATATPAPTATPVPTEAPAPTEAPEPTPEPTPAPTATPEPTKAPVSDDLTINFADLTAGGYGYEGGVQDGALVVTYSATDNYQEVQYILPEVIDLAKYSTLIVDVVSSGTLDIKLVNPEAATNEWGQLAPFADNYTADGVTEPVYIDLAGYASYDLSQINFMACATSIEATIKSMTFVK